MKSYIFLLVTLAVSSAFSINTTEPDIVDVGEEKTIAEANKGLLDDDILEPPNIQRSSIVDGNNLWTSPVPYVLDSGLEMNAKGVILRAFEQFRLKTCIDFKPRDSEDYYISFQKKDGCFSYIGRTSLNGQVISIGRFCDSIDTAEHEILHALGFYHEQSRFDRDNFVTVVLDNVLEGKKHNFRKVGSDESTTHGVPYDYWSVMHYSKSAFTNGNGATIITKDPKFQDVIGQNLEISTSDVQELNLLYKCNSTIAFMTYCGFSNGIMCQMSRCSQRGNTWEVVKQASGGPDSDHTTLPSGNSDHGQETGYFMHVSTASGQEGDSALLETQMMNPKRGCHVQCLRFYYYNSGNESDELNIWIREFQDEQDSNGTLRFMGQITGAITSHWKLQHVSLNATKQFQVVFEVRKGAGSSTGGFSIDDINLSETECPHVTLQIDDFEKLLNTSADGTRIYSPRQYSKEGYAYRIATVLRQTFFGVFVQILSGDFDDQLEFPCLRRQMTFQMLDQNPNIQLQMSKQKSFTTDETQVANNGISFWDNPRKTGSQLFLDENNQVVYGGVLYGYRNFLDMDTVKSREFLKGGSAIFAFNFQDLTPVVNGSTLPCPKGRPVNVTHPPTNLNEGPCSPRISPTTIKPPTTTDDRISPTTIKPPTTTDDRISPTTIKPPTTTDDSIFGFSPGMVASPVFTVLLVLMLLTA